MTQQNARGCYMNFEHDRAADWDFLAKWQPNVVRLMVQGSPSDPNSVSMNRIRRVYDTAPDATILVRCWEVDDNRYKAHEAMAQDPRATAERQVDWWAKVFDRAVGAGIPRERLMAGLNNETGPEKDASLYPYTKAALGFGTLRGVRLGVFVFSVGRPSLEGEADYTISTFSQLDNAIIANNGAVILHEYLQPEGMYCIWTDENGNERKDYTYLIGRHARWQIKSPIIIGEWGIDGILYNRHPDPKHGNSGWRNFPQEWTPDRYADEYVECVQKSSANVIGICSFISDPSDDKWFSFDPLEAYGALLARKDRCVKQIDADHDTHLPSIGTPATQPTPGEPSGHQAAVAVVSATAGANVRTGPGREYPVRGAEPFGTQMPIVGRNEGPNRWWKIDMPHISGWVSNSVVDARNTADVPVVDAPTEPTPSGDNFRRCLDFILRWEGLWAEDPNDLGGATMKGITLGTYTRWREAHGGSPLGAKPSKDDLRNISNAEVEQIYREWYWQASGADKLAWPLCCAHMDTAVNAGVGKAKEMHLKAGDDFLLYMGLVITWYTSISSFEYFGRAWMRRRADLLIEASKP